MLIMNFSKTIKRTIPLTLVTKILRNNFKQGGKRTIP
jgi:hypothetical protein